MNQEGMRIIKNDSLRNAIIFHYENKYKFLEGWNEAEWNIQFQDTRDIYRNHFSRFQVFEDLVPFDYSNLRENQEYMNYLNNRLGWLQVTNELYQDRIQRAEDLIELIKNEIEYRKK